MGSATSSAGNGSLSIVKEGGPLTSQNLGDRFPITVELVNEHGYDLSGVAVSGEGFLSARPAPGPGAAAGRGLAGVARTVAGAASAAGALPALRGLPGDGPLVALVDTGAPASPNVVARASVLGAGPGDDNGHGTAMLGAIVRENPGARVLSVKALGADGRGTAAQVRAAIAIACAAGADVVNLSLSAPDTAANAPVSEGVELALASGAQVVAAAGNGGLDAASFTPGCVGGAVTVGAAGADGRALGDSNRGACVDGYVEAGSTSEAAARVSGWLSGGEPARRAAGLAGSGLLACPGACAPAPSGAPARSDGAVRAAATYTVTVNYNANGGAITDSGGIHYWAEKGEYYKVVSSILYMSTTRNGTYGKAAGTVKSTARYHNLQDVASWGLTRTGYHIDGARAYNTKANGKGLDISEHNTAKDGENPATAARLNGGAQVTSDKTVTIYANWLANTYTVTYDANGGTGAPAATSHVYGTAKALAAGKPTRANHTFSGWQVNGAGTVYSAGQSVVNLTSANNATVAMKAKWVEDPKYTVTYDGAGGTPARASDTGYAGTQVTLPGATRAGYTFKGWSASGSAAGGSTGSYTITGDVTLHATWQEDDRVVTYDGNGGTPARASDTVSPGSSVTLPSVRAYPAGDLQDTGAYRTVTLSGNGGTVGGRASTGLQSAQYRDYSFSGWYTAASGGTRVGGSGSGYTPPQGSTTLYMQWSVAYRYRAVALPTPVRSGYEFRGWSTSSSASDGSTGSYTPSGDVTLYATWAAHTRRVIEVRPVAGQTVTLSGVPDGTTYEVTDGDQPYRWELVSSSLQSGTVPPGGTARVVSESRYTPPDDVELSFTVPVSIGFAARADGTLVGPSDGAVRIESATDAPIAVTGVKVDAADGFEVVGEPSGPGQVAFSLAPEGGSALGAVEAAGGRIRDVQWPIAAHGSLGISHLSGRIASWSDLSGAARKVASITWRIALADDSAP